MLPTTTSTADSWTPGFDFSSRLFGTSSADYELYEEDDDFVLNVDMPGFDREDIQVSWDEGRLFIWAEHEDDGRGRRKSFRRTFRLPKEIEPEEINAHYRNGVLEVRLPILGTRIRGTEIEVQG
ncbi:MAG: Hsp20/alpha crystallin family protein [Halobacteriales archaeon]